MILYEPYFIKFAEHFFAVSLSVEKEKCCKGRFTLPNWQAKRVVYLRPVSQSFLCSQAKEKAEN